MRQTNRGLPTEGQIPGLHRRIDPSLGLNLENPLMGASRDRTNSQGRFAMIGKLETGVSMLQTAQSGLERVVGHLQEMQEFLEEKMQSKESSMASSVADHFIKEQVGKIRYAVEAASFQDRAILNGKRGVQGSTTGKSLYFVRGSANVLSSAEPGYPVTVTRRATPSILVGAAKVSESNLKEESQIVLMEAGQEVRYKIRDDESPESLVEHLQQELTRRGIDISVYMTEDHHLLFRHNRLGSSTGFQGMSYRTRLISTVAQSFVAATPGEDIEGNLGLEPALGEGGFLIGQRGNRRTEGLIVYFDGVLSYPGQIVGYVHVTQNGELMPLDPLGHRSEILSIPTIQPNFQAVGAPNSSGFWSLESIRGATARQRRDALKLILWSLSDLEYLSRELKWKEETYVELAINFLRNTMQPELSGEDVVQLSKEKAGEMAHQLKSMLPQSMTSGISTWS